jgi:MFS family permease
MNGYLRFLSGHSANALSIGVQMVLVAWLATGVLQLPAQQVGWVQAAVLAPNLLIILFAGALSDRMPPARILVLVNGLLCVIHLGAYLSLTNNGFSLTALLLYALLLGGSNSFIQAAREKLLAQLTDQPLQKNIARAGALQQTAQGLGIALASLTDLLGPSSLLLVQVGLCAFATVAYATTVKPVLSEPSKEPLAQAIHFGLAQAWREVAVRHVIFIVGFNGFMHMGMLIVLLPLIARDQMDFSSLEFGMLQLSFVLGGVTAHWILLRKASVSYPGQTVLFCLLYAGLIGFAMSRPVTELGLFSLVFLWGCVAGSSANLSRVVVQSMTPVEYRGRVMAVYQLALFGMAPLGALLAGYLVKHGGIESAFMLIAWSSAGLFTVSLLTKPLWAVKPQDSTLG